MLQMSFQLTKPAYVFKKISSLQDIFENNTSKNVANLISVNESEEKMCKKKRGMVIEREEWVKNRLHHLDPVDDWNALISEEVHPLERDNLVLLVSPGFVIAVVRRVVGFQFLKIRAHFVFFFS